VKGENGVIETAIGRSLKDRKRFSSRTRKGRVALTEWKIVKRYHDDLTLMEIRLRTGRTHQIRVHFTELGHPLVGDLFYGSKRQLNRIRSAQRQKVVSEFARPALHAARLGFTHPVSGKWMEFEAPLPEDFRELLDNL
jgi:23S rRNA pseudouridine1911/1915/1917 synthase